MSLTVIQIIVGIALGLILVAFFIAVMYYILPDEAVNQALAFFENLWQDLLDSTIGRLLDIIFSPVTALTSAILTYIAQIGARYGPATAFLVALIGLLRSSRALVLTFSQERALTMVDQLARATAFLLALAGLSAVIYKVATGIESLLSLTPALIIRAKRRTAKRRTAVKLKVSGLTLARLGYIVAIIVIILVAIHATAEVAEVIRPNSDTAKLLKELDLLDKFFIIVREHVTIE